MFPTRAQFYDYRKELRESVHILNDCIKHNTIPLGDWAKEVIKRNRKRHSESIKREKSLI